MHVHAEEYKGYVIKIFQYADVDSPEFWGDESLFLTGHHRNFHVKREGFMFTQKIPYVIKKAYHVFPLHAYIHSGVALSLNNGGYPFNDRWDAGQVGYVLAKKSEFRGRKKGEVAATALVETWNDYLSGNIYGFVIEELTEEHVDSCWGFYGDYDKKGGALMEARSVVNSMTQ
jgi:hypothetical protein